MNVDDVEIDGLEVEGDWEVSRRLEEVQGVFGEAGLVREGIGEFIECGN